jgi:cytidylate kinase
MAILTISREFGSGGREIGQAVADQMGYTYLDKEGILQEIRMIGSRWEDWAKDLDEHRPTIWEKYDWSFRGLGALIQSTILSYAVKGRLVVMGRGGSFLLKDIPFALRIRVVAPLESRIARIMMRASLDRETAQWLAEKTDHDRASFIHALYGKNWQEPSEFDLLCDTSQQTPDQIVAIVKNLLVEKDRHHSEAGQKILEMRALAAKVKAGLLTDPSLFIPILDVNFDGRDIVLRGVIHNPKEHRRVEEAARKLAAGHSLKCDLHYRG